MNIYKISRNPPCDWDQYISAVVLAESEARAAEIHPNGMGNLGKSDTWVSSKDVIVEYLGIAKPDLEEGVIVASFDAR